jgi:GrpB-like predicted nucleotidyltransferase (UPF0157 family)
LVLFTEGHFGGSMGQVFVKESAPNVVTTIVHVLEESSGYVERYTLFRNALLENKDLVEQYAGLKAKLLKQFPESQVVYTKGKKEFIDAVIEKQRQAHNWIQRHCA